MAKDRVAPEAVVAGLLFASGVSALLYQVIWIKQLSLVVGVDVYAVTIGISAFFAGLALGGIVLGRIADRTARPFRLFALLELAAAVGGVAATITLSAAAPLFASLEDRAGAVAWILVWGLVGMPAVAMGASVPVMTRALVAPGAPTAAGGRLYAANTAGAILGAMASAFALIPWLGVRGTAVAAATINLATALGALALDRAAAPGGPVAKPAAAFAPDQARLALALYAAAGAVALGYEVVWSQAMVPLMSTRAFAFVVMLGTYLAGLALGSALYSRAAERLRDPWGAFGFLISVAGLIALLEIAILGRWLIIAQTWAEFGVLALTNSALAGMSARFAVAAACVVLLPTLALGAAFPAMLRVTVGNRRVGRDVGAVIALNTAGGIVGAIVTGFMLVPLIGLVRSLTALALGAAVIGLLAVARGPGVRSGARWMTATVAALIALTALAVPSDRLATLLPGARTGALTFYEESSGGTVAVVEQPAGRFRRLYIQGVSNSGDAMPSLRYMRLQALLPLIIHRDEPRSAMVIGLGTGITAGALLQYPGLERRVCAELLPAVVSAAPLFAGNFGAASDQRLEIRIRDGRRELLRSPERYDLITLEPPPPSAAGVVNLYSSDFYALAATRLTPGGILAQWWPLPAQNDEDSRSLVRSFLNSFPYASLWTTELHEMLLVGSAQPIELDATRIRARFAQPQTAAALREVGVASPAALLATWITDRRGLERYVNGAPPVTDDRPRIEYASWVRPGEIMRVLPRLLALATEAPLASADGALRASISAERERLWRFYRAGLDAYARETERSARELRRILSEDGDNPYYRWFAGGRPS